MDSALCGDILASSGVLCRSCDSGFLVDTTWNVQILIRKAGEEEVQMGSAEEKQKRTWKLLFL